MTRVRSSRSRFVAHVMLAAAVCVSAPAHAQQVEAPRLGASKDPNDWEAYYDLGIEWLRNDPVKAERAFLWASRLRPDRAEPLYARWVAFWSKDIPRFRLYLEGDKTTLRMPTVQSADSLRLRALRRSPFVHQGPQMLLFDLMPGRFRSDPVTRAWIHLGLAQMDQALDLFALVIRREPARYGYLRFVRASAFANTGRADSALAELTTLLAQLRAADQVLLVEVYESKELLEYASGLLHLSMGKRALAREAFGRAIVENAGFGPAHAHLGLMALSARDTTEALDEFRLASEMDPTDVEVLVGFGRTLAFAKRPLEAVEQLRKAVALEPLYAAPYLLLASQLEAAADSAAARATYGEFLARTTKADPQRAMAERRMQALSRPQ